MIPDKIYLQRNTTTDLYDDLWPEWFEDTHNPDSDICYIRKDALLEWAKDMKAETEAVIKQHPEDESLWAEMHWWKVVIAKINAM